MLIIGQGLAGSLLAHALDRLGASFIVADGDCEPAASLAAPGLISPYAGPRWQAPEPVMAWFLGAIRAWRAVERRLRTRLLRSATLHRLPRDAAEVSRAQRRRLSAAGARLLGPVEAVDDPRLNAPFGQVRMRVAQVDLRRFLAATREWLTASGRLHQADVDADALAFPASGGVLWQGQRLDAAVVCTGHRARVWPHFQGLHWRISHGEALILDQHPALPRIPIARGKALLPWADGCLWFGATYGRQTAAGPTAAGRQELLSALAELLSGHPQVTVRAHVAGVRAGHRDGLVFCGPHPRQGALYLFGGLGSRGTLVAPHCAQALAAHLCHGTVLPLQWRLTNGGA